MKLTLPFPPSVNTYWRAPNKGPLAGRHLISAEGRKYQSAACAAIIEQLRCLPKPSTKPAAVEITLYPPDARRRMGGRQPGKTHAGGVGTSSEGRHGADHDH